MKKLLIACTALGLLSGCATTHQERATTQGAVVGATAGAVIGAQSDRAVEGAFIGGILGGLAGAVLSDDGSDRVMASEPRYHRRSCRQGAQYFDRAARVRNLNRKISLMRQGLRLCPGNPAAHNDLGVALMLRGDYAEARKHFGHALKLDPGYIPARRNMERLHRGARHEMKRERRKMKHHRRHHDKHEYDDGYDDHEDRDYRRGDERDDRYDHRYDEGD